MARRRLPHLPWQLVSLLVARAGVDGGGARNSPFPVRPAPSDGGPHDVFVSYAEPDAAWVEGYLHDALAAAGVSVHTEAAFTLGRPRLLEFERAVRNSHRVLLVISAAYLADEAAAFVDLLAQTFGMETSTWPVIPLVLEEVHLPTRLAMLTRLDATDPARRGEVVDRLCAELSRPLPPPTPSPPCPYPGMRPFTLAEAPLFHGRTAEVDELVRCLQAQRSATRRFLAVIGPSGSGKSSLVIAGLIPALQRSRLFGTGAWEVVTLRPGTEPLSTPTTVAGTDPPVPGPTVPELARLLPAGPRLLVVDQFEELFTTTRSHAPDQATEFQQELENVAALANSYVVITARADFYPDLMTSPAWPLIQAQRVEVLPLDEASLRRAISVPAERVGVYVEAALVERLVADAAGEPGALPLVQQTLVLLWDHLERRYLPLRAYEALVLPQTAYAGMSTGERTGLQVAVARHADTVLADLSPAQQAIARRVFLRLIQFGTGRADTRRQRTVADLRAVGDDPTLFDATIDHLATHRLLTLSAAAGSEGSEAAARVDLAHEALIAGWPWLQQLVAQRREAEQMRERLEDKAAEWTRLGRSRGGLLDEAELAEATRWLDGPDATELGYSAALPTLIAASREEIALERRQLRTRMYVAIAFAVLALVAALFAFTQYQTADDNARQAEAAQATAERQADLLRPQSLILQAPLQKLVGEDERGLLLARQAYLFDQQSGGEALGLVDDSLRSMLGPASFSVTFTDGSAGWITSVAMSSDGSTLVTGGLNGAVRFWDAKSGKLTSEVSLPGYAITTVTFDPSGTALAASAKGTGDGRVAIWNINDLEAKPTLLQHATPVRAVAYTRDGTRVITGGDDGVIRLWDPASPDAAPQVLDAGGAQVLGLDADTSGQRLAASYGDGTVRVWNMPDNGRLDNGHTLPGTCTAANAVAFSPDGSRLAAACQDKTVRLWRLANPNAAPAILQHDSPVWSVRFSPNGAALASGSADTTARLWNPDDRSAAPVVLDHDKPVTALVFTLDGTSVVTASSDGTLRRIDVDTGDLADRVCATVGRNLSLAEWQRFVGPTLPYQSTCPNLPPGEGAPASFTEAASTTVTGP